jgi:hypothetical protein
MAFTISRKTRSGANVTMTVNGTVHSGRVSNPAGANAPHEWVSTDLLRGIVALPVAEQTSVLKAIRANF